LVHKATESWLRVKLDQNGAANVNFVPSPGGMSEGSARFNHFHEAQRQVNAWLGWVQEDSQPDPWADIPFGADAFGNAADPDDNEPLTPGEKEELVHRVDNARRVLLEAGLSDDKLADANEKLDQASKLPIVSVDSTGATSLSDAWSTLR
jgi:hypothetical protein